MHTRADKKAASYLVKKGVIIKEQAEALLKELDAKFDGRVFTNFLHVAVERVFISKEKLIELVADATLINIFHEEDKLYASLATKNDIASDETIEAAMSAMEAHRENGEFFRVFEIMTTLGKLPFREHERLVPMLNKVSRAREEGKTVSEIFAPETIVAEIATAKAVPISADENDLWTVVLSREGGREVSRVPTAEIDKMIRMGRVAENDFVQRSFERARVPVGTNLVFSNVFAGVRKRRRQVRLAKKIAVFTVIGVALITVLFSLRAYKKGRDEDRQEFVEGRITEVKEDLEKAGLELENGSYENPAPWIRSIEMLEELKKKIRKFSAGDKGIKKQLAGYGRQIEKLLKSDELRYKAMGDRRLGGRGQWLEAEEYAAAMEKLEIEELKSEGYVHWPRPGVTGKDEWVHPDVYNKGIGRLKIGGEWVSPSTASRRVLTAERESVDGLVERETLSAEEFRRRVIAGGDPGVLFAESMGGWREYSAAVRDFLTAAEKRIGEFDEEYDHSKNPDKIPGRDYTLLQELAERNRTWLAALAAKKVRVGETWVTENELKRHLLSLYCLAEFESKPYPVCLVPFLGKIEGIQAELYEVTIGNAEYLVTEIKYTDDKVLVRLVANPKTVLAFDPLKVSEPRTVPNPRYVLVAGIAGTPLNSAAPFEKAYKQLTDWGMDDWAARVGEIVSYIDPEFTLVGPEEEKALSEQYRKYRYWFVCVDGKFYSVRDIDRKGGNTHEGSKWPKEYEKTVTEDVSYEYITELDALDDRIGELESKIAELRKRENKDPGNQGLFRKRTELDKERKKLKAEKKDLEKKRRKEIDNLISRYRRAWRTSLVAVGIGQFGLVSGYDIREILGPRSLFIIHIQSPPWSTEMERHNSYSEYVKLIGVNTSGLIAPKTVAYDDTDDYFDIAIIGTGTLGSSNAKCYVAAPMALVRKGLTMKEFQRAKKEGLIPAEK